MVTTAETLMAEWKNRQDITWEADDQTNAKLLGIVERGMDALRSRAGNQDLVFEGETKSLLFDYCRYDFNNSRELFDSAFRAELNVLRLREGFGLGQFTTENDGDL